MKYSLFERLTLAVGIIAVAGTIVASYRGQPIVEEVVAQILLVVVLVGAVHWGRNGGFVAAVGATLVYILMRIPLLIDQGLAPEILEMIAIRTVTYGVIGILGGELCSRVKYIFASLEDSDAIDQVTRVYNERFIAKELRAAIGRHERYGDHVACAVITLDPALYEPLRKSRQRSMLRGVAGHVRNDIRLVDDLGRLHDGRFLVVFPDTPREGAEVAAERLRAGLRGYLGAREESVDTVIMGTPEDAGELIAFAKTLVKETPPVLAQEPSGA